MQNKIFYYFAHCKGALSHSLSITSSRYREGEGRPPSSLRALVGILSSAESPRDSSPPPYSAGPERGGDPQAIGGRRDRKKRKTFLGSGNKTGIGLLETRRSRQTGKRLNWQAKNDFQSNACRVVGRAGVSKHKKTVDTARLEFRRQYCIITQTQAT